MGLDAGRLPERVPAPPQSLLFGLEAGEILLCRGAGFLGLVPLRLERRLLGDPVGLSAQPLRDLVGCGHISFV